MIRPNWDRPAISERDSQLIDILKSASLAYQAVPAGVSGFGADIAQVL